MKGVRWAGRAASRSCFAGQLTCWWSGGSVAWRRRCGSASGGRGSVVVDGNAGAGNRTEQGVGAEQHGGRLEQADVQAA